ncbi:MAG: prolyl-tRNA synthetase associated domain-containing protein [Oscillospiraceae bacterium]
MYVSEIMTAPPSAEHPEKEQAVFALLESLGVPYERLEHDAVETMEQCAEINEKLGVKMAKNIFLTNRQGTQLYLLLMPDDKPFNTKVLCEQINSPRLSFASGEQMEQLLGCLPGCASPMGLMNDSGHQVTLLMDQSIHRSEYLVCHPCVHTGSLKIKTFDFLKKFCKHTGHRPTVVKM